MSKRALSRDLKEARKRDTKSDMGEVLNEMGFIHPSLLYQG